MEISNFSSLFEIYCTIYLAYIITDNFYESNFIATITEKILRKYQKIHDAFNKMNQLVLGSETSLYNLQIIKPKDEDNAAKESEYEKQLKLKSYCFTIIETQKSKIAQNKKEVYAKIRDSYQTKSFSFIALYLTLNAIAILLFSGISQAICNNSIENCLLMINIFTITFLYFAWEYDAYDYTPHKKSWAHKFVFWIISWTKFNGYEITLLSILGCLLFSIAVYFITPINIGKWYIYYHTALILSTILLPLINFIVYFKKAANNAAYVASFLTVQVQLIAEDVERDLKEIEEYVTYFKVDNKLKIQ
jgi:hypothetical protein